MSLYSRIVRVSDDRPAKPDKKASEGKRPEQSGNPPKPKMGRPRTGYIKAEYNRQYSADLRTIKRLGLNCTVKEYRESLK